MTNVNNTAGDVKIKGGFGRKGDVSPMGGVRVGESVRLVGSGFIGSTVDTNFWAVQTPVGTGTATQAYGAMTIATGTTANSSQIVYSVRTARYVAANPNFYRANIRIPTITTGSVSHKTTIRFGAFDASDGYFFEYNQTNPETTPTLSVVSRKTDGTGTNDSPTNSGNFNGDVTSYTVDTKCHTYEIWWTNKNTYFLIDNVLIHTINAADTSAVATPSLKVGLSIANSGGNNANNTFVVRSSTINKLGPMLTQPTSYYYASGTTGGTQLKIGPGNIHELVILSVAQNGAVITLADSTSAATPIIIATGALTAKTDPIAVDLKGAPFYAGLRLVVATQSASCMVVYE